MKITALIMAGGKGERFWPRSRQSLPKQFLALTDDNKTMIQQTVERILPMVEPEDIYISTNRSYRRLVLEQLPQIPKENILCEPVGRNTAPCIGLGAVHISQKYEDAIMLVLPSDHLIQFQDQYLDTLKEACRVAEQGENLVTLGITPSYPETGYGYIKFLPQERDGQAYSVDCFVEKPDLETAEQYLLSGQYLWNSGVFIWKLSTILKELERLLPDTYERLQRIREAIGTEQQEEVLEREFDSMESQSIDYGVMEKADHIYILPGNFGWDDVGSWLAVGRLKKPNKYGNVIDGNAISILNRNCIIQADEKLIAVVGLKDTIVVDTEDATLICAKEKAGEIRRVLENLRMDHRDEYL